MSCKQGYMIQQMHVQYEYSTSAVLQFWESIQIIE